MSASDEPIISIVIPVVNNLKYNRECVESLFLHSANDINHEIIIIDNNSNDGSREYFESLGDSIRLITNEEVRSFARSCNQGAKEARGRYLLFLNNDTYVTHGWLAPLLDCFKKHTRIGLVANKQLFPSSGLTSHVGGGFTPQGLPEHLYLFFDPNLPFLNEAREMQWVTACCIMIPRSLYREMGGFDEAYKNSYEDIDLCFRVRSKDYKVFYCPESVVYHYGQATTGRKIHEEANRELFLLRWGNQVKNDIVDIVRADSVESYLDNDHHLERLLYERYLLMQNNSDIPEEIAFYKEQAENLKLTLSWRVTKPLRDAKRIFKNLFKGDS